MLIKNIIIISALISFYVIPNTSHQYLGIFHPTDPQLNGITYGNWGSRPYEYFWASKVIPVQNKKIIDLGVGLPSQYNWYKYVIKKLKPSFYAGIDCDGRIKKETQKSSNYEIQFMDMSKIEYPDKSFDIAYCISTYEHIPFEIFMETIRETYRVLNDDGILIATLDEEWDKNQPLSHDNGWNTLEQSLCKMGFTQASHRSFGLPEFLILIQDYFVPYQEDAIIDIQKGIIYSKDNPETIYYDRKNEDTTILNSGLPINSCVSYVVLRKNIAH